MISYNVYQSNNDYEMSIPAERVIGELEFELTTGTSGLVQIRADLSKEEALKVIDNLRWLVERSYRKEGT